MRHHGLQASGKTSVDCDSTGNYAREGKQVKVTFAQGSGQCNNRARSPQWSVVCGLDEEKLECEGSSIVDGKSYNFTGVFE